MFESLTPEFFDTLIIVIIIIGLAMVVVRLYADFSRPLPPEDSSRRSTQPSMPAVPSEPSAESAPDSDV